jgi:signal transduction histidine kinase
MTAARIPGTTWTWRHTTLVVGVLLAPVLGLSIGLPSSADPLVATARFDALLVWPAAMVSAFACYAAWRIRPRPGLAWATIGLAVLSFQELARTTLLLVSPNDMASSEVLVGDLVPALVAVAIVAVGHHLPQLPDPAATGFGLGALMAAARLAGFELTGGLEQHLSQWVICAVYVAVISVLAGAVWLARSRYPHDRSMPLWARERTAIAIAMIGAAHLALYLGKHPAAVIVGDTLGAVLLVSTYLAHLVREIEAADRTHDELVDELAGSVDLDQAYRARMHEIRSTVAGISSATHLLRSTQEISVQRRTQLDGLVVAELGRLERLLALPVDVARRTGAPDHVEATDAPSLELDSVIGLIVLSHEARGQRVRWTPSHLWVRAHSDAVAQIVNTLLDNAAKHAHSAVDVSAEQQGDVVEVMVHDHGPGIDPSMRGGLFGWGVRGPNSSGQGIGLHVARHLAQRQDGYLLVHDTDEAGATFVLGLPYDVTGGHPPGGRDEHPSMQPGRA